MLTPNGVSCMMTVMLVSEIDRLMPQGSLRVPNHRADKAKGEWDWYYQLGPAVRRRLLRHCKPDGIGPDECAQYAGYAYVDEWAADLVAAVTDHDTRETGPELFAASDLVGPVEIGELLNVPANTVHQWAKRGRLPHPIAIVSSTRLWLRGDIEEWAMETGRQTAAGEDF